MREFFALQFRDAFVEALRLQVPLHAVVVLQREAGSAARQGDAPEGFFAVRIFGGFGFQKLAARRCVEIQIAYFYCGACGKRRGFGRRQLRAFGGDRPRVFIVAGVTRIAMAAGEREARHRGDARQRFAAKAETADTLEIIQRGDFAGGVARERKRQFVARDARAVVTDFE